MAPPSCWWKIASKKVEEAHKFLDNVANKKILCPSNNFLCEDAKSLQGHNIITGNCIIVFLKAILRKLSGKGKAALGHLFQKNAPEGSKLQSFSSDTSLFILNPFENHFCVVVFQPIEKTAYVADSWQEPDLSGNTVKFSDGQPKASTAYDGENEQLTNLILGANGFNTSDWKTEYVRGPKQSDDHNCGLFAAMNAMFYLSEGSFPKEESWWTSLDAPDLRMYMAFIIKKHSNAPSVPDVVLTGRHTRAAQARANSDNPVDSNSMTQTRTKRQKVAPGAVILFTH